MKAKRKHYILDITVCLLAVVFIAGYASMAFEPFNTDNQSSIATEEEQQYEQVNSEEPSSTNDIPDDEDINQVDSESSQEEETSSENDLGNLSVTFIDVGQGDSEFIELPDGKTMLIDAGESSSSSTILAELKSSDIDQIDYFIISHPHADHIGGAEAVLNAYQVGEIWIPDAPSTTKTYESFLDTVDEQGLVLDEAQAGKVIIDESAGYSVELLAPSEGVDSDDMNDYSSIVKISYGDTSFLFTGDASASQIINANPGHVDVLKAAHHGSETGTNSAVMRETTADYVILSYAEGNSYGHPDRGVLDAVSAAGATAYSTAANGNIIATSDGTTVTVSVEKNGEITAGVSKAEKAQQKTETGNDAESQSDTQDDEIVLITPTGSKYHRSGCRSLSRSKTLTKITRAEAEARGYDPCKICM